MKTPFNQCSYFSQLRRLRELAKVAIDQYAIGKYDLKFVNHGENTTYRVITKNREYLLRIHRNGYHSQKGLLEELKWLNRLSTKTDILLQVPVSSKTNQMLIKVSSPAMGEPRFCSLLIWQKGYIKTKATNQNFYDIGVLIAKMQKNPIQSKHRIYWNTEGLVGQNGILGSLKAIKKDYNKELKKIEPYRQLAYRKLKSYEKKYPNKLSMIHGDLHFGNMIWKGQNISPIDFDDCGYGFHMYDLAVTMHSSINHFLRVGKREATEAREALLSGYNLISNTSEDDLKIIPYLMLAREITMIGWLYERKDNPVLLKHLHEEIGNKIKRMKRYHLYMG